MSLKVTITIKTLRMKIGILMNRKLVRHIIQRVCFNRLIMIKAKLKITLEFCKKSKNQVFKILYNPKA